MSLNSISFIWFLPLVVFVNFKISPGYRYIWLFAASLFFYLSNDIRFLGGLALCVVTTYGAGLFLDGKRTAGRKAVLALCVTVNVLVLLAFRYIRVCIPFAPLGISFYALQALGYVFDVYGGRLRAERNPVRYAVFVSFFPTVLSGPIQRAGQLLPQIKEGPEFDYGRAHSGLYALLYGFLLKIAIVNRLSFMVDRAFEGYQTLPGATLLWAAVLYAMQLYFDFAGYSALAVGSARLLGFEISGNFAQPYFAASIREFWGRWHISLSSWLRDYIYIPLGGNRKGKARKCVNLMLTFLVSGIWHGAGLQFLIWGALHGLYQVAETLFGGKKRGGEASGIAGFVRRIPGMVVTFLLVDFAWIFFRAESAGQAIVIIKRIVTQFRFREMTYQGSYLLGGSRLELVMVLLGILTVLAVDFLHERRILLEKAVMGRLPIVIRWSVYLALTMLILYVSVHYYGEVASTFIYSRF